MARPGSSTGLRGSYPTSVERASVSARRTNTPFAVALPGLIDQHNERLRRQSPTGRPPRDQKLSIRSLAKASDVDPSFFAKALHGKASKRLSAQVIRRASRTLGLPEDYFPEVREQAVLDAVRAELRQEPARRDELYDRVVIGQRGLG